MKRAKALIHGIAKCAVCEWICEDYLVVQRRAAAHARKTGHTVNAELGYAVSYGHEVVKLTRRRKT